MDRICKRVNKKFPCRSGVVKSLVELIGDANEAFPPAVYIHGNAGTGKTSLVKETIRQIQKHSNIQSVFLNSIECYTTKILLENIVADLSSNNEVRCDTLKDFIIELSHWEAPTDNKKGYIIVMDNVERVRDMDANILPTFLRLPELTGLNICCLLISKLPFEKYYCLTGLSEVVILHCPQYNKNEVQKILSHDFVHAINFMRAQLEQLCDSSVETRLKILDTITLEFFNNYLNLFLSVFYKACRDLPELKLTSRSCFSIYLEPVLTGSIEANDVRRLWQHIAGPLRSALSQVYMRCDQGAYAAEQTEVQQDQSVKKLAQSLELPYYGKYLLIAAFLASHNSAKQDKRLFVKHHGKQRKRMQTVNAKMKMAEKMSTSLGPKSFSIDRLLAIFYAILDEKVGLTCNLLSQISTLVHLKLLSFASGENNVMDGSSRMQCTVGLEFILYIGRVVGFNVREYLCDFM